MVALSFVHVLRDAGTSAFENLEDGEPREAWLNLRQLHADLQTATRMAIDLDPVASIELALAKAPVDAQVVPGEQQLSEWSKLSSLLPLGHTDVTHACVVLHMFRNPFPNVVFQLF